jgi:hypothetical protein
LNQLDGGARKRRTHHHHDLEQSLIERYENFEILTKLRMKFYGITQAVGEPADVFITKKSHRP